VPTAPIIDAVVAAINGGDADAFLRLFQETGTVDDWGSVHSGPAEIKAWSDRELIGVRARFDLLASEPKDDTADMRVEVGGGGFNGPSRFTFKLRGGKIQEMRIRAD
jgi:hypothetical protein